MRVKGRRFKYGGVKSRGVKSRGVKSRGVKSRGVKSRHMKSWDILFSKVGNFQYIIVFIPASRSHTKGWSHSRTRLDSHVTCLSHDMMIPCHKIHSR